MPDFRTIATVLRRGTPARVPYYGHFVDGEIIEQIMGFRLDDPGLSPRENDRRRWGLQIQFYAQMGYDYLPMEIAPRFAQRSELLAADTAHYSRGQRGWVDEHGGPIRSMADLENPANWPQVEDLADYNLFRDVAAMLPPGMKIIGGLSGGPFEHASFLMGLEPLSIALYDAPELATRLFARIGEALTGAAERLAALDGLGAYRFGDDLGYKNATILSPAKLRELVFPWQKRIVAAVHRAGKPFVLHSCGQLAAVMDDLIDEVGIDAKHSYEDTILPVSEAKRLYGQRVAILGGIDVHFLATAAPHEIKERVKRTLDACAPGGGYALGSGNTIANYIPVPNYLAMLEAAREWNGL
ncbi:MAG: uroporphyrinogen decarboxylase family protein [Bacteroidota bacterium]